MQNLKDTSSYRVNLKRRILQTAMRLFAEQGVKAVKMDDIAQQLGISKRTLYEIYQDKEELLYQGVVAFDKEKRARIGEFSKSANNVIEVIAEAYRMKVQEVHTVNPLFYDDILKYPRVEQYLKEIHVQTHEGYLLFMQKGVNEGSLRPDVNYNLFHFLLEGLGMYIMSNQLLKKYSVEELFENLFLVSLRGLCTQKGLHLLDEAFVVKNH